MKINGLLDHKHRPQGGCNLGDDCPAKEEKLLKVIKLDLNASGDCEGEEIDLKGDWCDLCLKLGPISVVGFTCLNEKCPNHGVGEEFPVYLCSICDKPGSVKCPYSGSERQWAYPGDHKFVRAKMLQELFKTMDQVSPKLFMIRALAQLKLIKMILNEYEYSDDSGDIASASADDIKSIKSPSNALETLNLERLNFLTEEEEVRMANEQSLEDENASREGRTINYNEVC